MNCWSTASDVVKFFVFGRIISLVYLAPALRGGRKTIMLWAEVESWRTYSEVGSTC